MEIRNNVNRLDHYLNRVDLEKARGGAQGGAPGGLKVNTGGLFDGSDKVTLSSSALREVVTREALAAPDIRQDKVAAVKASLEAGEYEIDAREIAGKILGGSF